MPKKIKKGKIVRREGINLYDSEKYAKILARRPYKPGVHGPRLNRKRGSTYEQQLRAKQQLKLLYGLRERQFKNLVTKAISSKKNSAEFLVQLLESRLDNVVYRLGLAKSRSQARQLVNHGHMAVNGRAVNIPSYLAKKGDVVSIRERSRTKPYFAKSDEASKKTKNAELPMWLSWDMSQSSGKITGEPDSAPVSSLISVSRVIEFYSR